MSGSRRTLTDDVSDIVFSKLSPGGKMKTLEIDEDAAMRDGSLDAQKWDLGLDIMSKYQIADKERIKAVLAHAVAEANKLLARVMITSPGMDSELLQRLQAAFAADYVGEAHVKFHQYLVRCWTTYKMSSLKFTSPYGTLMQSSGFGKSRLLHELAKMTATDDEKASTDMSMRVLYVCARNNAQSSGFPRATPKLMELLFGKHSTEESMTQILLQLLTYAQQHWAQVGTTWLELFTNPSADKAVAEAIALASTTDNPVQSESSG